ncbi:MAG: hypothetical protein Q7V09_20705 [Hydrogenophaga sp.]|uniref:hypothetical protein n=1 Tax=Hydrogenophaga sp. TaxID=1904254 RepID=UPI00271D1A5C|nr:hypothetical protein [Hydrogenophaga sp.]MDO9032856.1 hypothetical protein [Hydrogenophaga sp.]
MLNLSVSALRRVLWLDAASGLGMAVAHFALSDLLSEWLGLSLAWLQVSGVIVCGAALLSGALASRARPPAAGVRLLAAGNFLWVAASVWAVWGAGLPLTTLGAVWVLLQAAFVFGLAELEWAGSRQAQSLAVA